MSVPRTLQNLYVVEFPGLCRVQRKVDVEDVFEVVDEWIEHYRKLADSYGLKFNGNQLMAIEVLRELKGDLNGF